MSHINIVFAHLQRTKSEKLKQIEECEKLSRKFWQCMKNNSQKENVSMNCGQEFYYMNLCLNKIN